MKKIVFIIVCILVTIPITADSIFEGSWKVEDDNTVYTFNKDTLYIDEVGNEGDVYTYHIDGDSIIAKNSLNDSFSFYIQKTMMNTIEISFDTVRFELHRVDNYDYTTGTFKTKK